MLTSLVYMFLVIWIFGLAKDHLSPAMKRSFLHKKAIFATKLLSTAGKKFKYDILKKIV